jgi:hypothetical protein
MTTVPDVFGIVANVIQDAYLRNGAKVWIVYCNGDASNPRVIGISKNGRIVEKYIPYKRLRSFRAKWLPEHLRDRLCYQYTHKADADAHAAALHVMWDDVRAFKPDGTLIKDGISAGEAMKRYIELRQRGLA